MYVYKVYLPIVLEDFGSDPPVDSGSCSHLPILLARAANINNCVYNKPYLRIFFNVFAIKYVELNTNDFTDVNFN